ncbi:hypothetical protein BMG03_03370 [Thioclava nitratireducens]|uniref:Flagellar motility protein MotE, a chaperone for MotC folding n=1 Tax=Thioclava nitratireducens TaxID=1915078 RepID=A0ABN4X379_9RHOB|nr:hypothetical protein [Thioclava nitratireducens]AQS46941.1 hypothetical protein BMG03_03370 [Thioclava nitratireducens]
MVKSRPLQVLVGVLLLSGGAKLATSLPTDMIPFPDSLLQAALASGAEKPTAAKASSADAPSDAKISCAPTPEELLMSVRQERDLLAEQKKKLDARSAEIELAKQGLDTQSQHLTELKDKVTKLLDQVDKSHTADVDRLVSIYKNMKPAAAASIMNDLDIEVTVMVLATMNERDVAPIMAAMTPVRARAVSKIILERSKLPGDQKLVNVKLN